MKTTENKINVTIVSRHEIDNHFWHNLVVEHKLPVYLDWFYLDSVTDWEVISINNFETFCPLPFRKRILKNYIQPLYTHSLQWFGKERNDSIFNFLSKKSKYINLYWEIQENIPNCRKYQYLLTDQLLDFPSYKLKKNINFANKSGLIIEKNLDKGIFIELYSKWMKKKIGFYSNKPIKILEKLITNCLENNSGMIYAAKNTKNEIVCADFFAFNNHFLYLPACVTLPESRKTRAHLFTVFHILKDYGLNTGRKIHFGGSNNPNYASFNYNFGSTDGFYKIVKKNSLLRLF
jgi:uncharacterized protein YlaN (UPF0358 family)